MKKLAYITGSRAEYGIVKRLLIKLQQCNDIDLSVIATAMHLDKQYGFTVNNIIEDGIKVSHKIPLTLDSSNNEKVIDSMAECLSLFGHFFQKNYYDAIMILGDRYEMLSVAIAAAMHNIPIIHLHGGEKTLGNYDEFIRHSITKMAKLHLVSTEEYKKRVIQLGEKPDSVINIGSLGAENSILLPLHSKEYIYNKIGYKKPYFVVLFHPETLLQDDLNMQVDELLKAINALKNKYDFIFIGSNSDTGSDLIHKKISNYINQYNYKYFNSLTSEEYLTLVKYSQGLIGNSSSGLIEIPSLKVPTINLGNRQLGRVRGETVIDCPVCSEQIVKCIVASQEKAFLDRVKNSQNPYRKQNTLQLAYDSILEFIASPTKTQLKDFWDL
ncbi:UDP-N-acetylglucosamine 2-epimerase [Avibacterium paragallinarum]|uniref:Nnaa n=2 Tax=Avibacterium paragallinarum TaxID=728 RepID=A0A0F5ER45_AVIPA|nr:UDP-N-acetylglucosamine 2-epimerase [Avibacterium paragallinarum]AZI13964.1 UDP-N-acetylglucosamine 2-epimerase (hydrolyzing) [Avibacterium paragallinarum]POY47032.1 UDP-N-acetylglucosamine 2-epimerase (hydrolyzing) [Avibacterium paragallinarum]QIR11427.1 UDP-N-acetylglucosamine 2-epimerase (hydrolyzing) [Avibacterium paragallinarum]QJE09599.1 UDP-N-acetylglucosamine 2-epimerase (hydrolyzing) [Avibacterium paragallinarum]QJE11795.1 UDP-N-acetylglucosamine 2-epimerase (hydrolyzing) [Avibacte